MKTIFFLLAMLIGYNHSSAQGIQGGDLSLCGITADIVFYAVDPSTCTTLGSTVPMTLSGNSLSYCDAATMGWASAPTGVYTVDWVWGYASVQNASCTSTGSPTSCPAMDIVYVGNSALGCMSYPSSDCFETSCSCPTITATYRTIGACAGYPGDMAWITF